MFDRKQIDKEHSAEDFLKHASHMAAIGESVPVSKILDKVGFDPGSGADLLKDLEAEACLTRNGKGWELTESGWRRGRQILRAHRVYESYLAESTGMPPSEWHAAAEREEHRLDEAEVDRMATVLNRPRFDPHGDAIPTRSLDMEEHEGNLLSQVVDDGFYRILHLEDEPAEPFDRTVAAGLGPDIIVAVQVLSGGRYHLSWAGQNIIFDSAQAAGCLVTDCGGDISESELPQGTLNLLPVGEEATLHSLSPVVRGLQRRRLLDLGFVPGSRVVKEGTGALRGPMRFRVRGTIQALREDIADKIYIQSSEKRRMNNHDADSGTTTYK